MTMNAERKIVLNGLKSPYANENDNHENFGQQKNL